MTNTGNQAIILAKQQSMIGPKAETGMCLKMVRGCYGVPAKADDAATAWADAAHEHNETNPSEIPYGVPVFWTGGSKGHGHIAISTGNGECWSTDITRPGYFDHVRIADIQRKWGMELVGWTEDVNGIRVWTAPVAKPKPKSRGKAIDTVITALTKARAANAALNTPRAKTKVKQIDAALTALKKIPAI